MATPQTKWHAEATDAAFTRVDSTRAGLSAAEAALRLERDGPNALPQARGRGMWQRLTAQFLNLLIIILIVAAVVTLALGHFLDAAVITGVVVINAMIGFIQEGKAERALEAIHDMLSPRARVLRDGSAVDINAADLVVGDIVLLRSGDHVPADMRLVEARILQTDESALTGESLPVAKRIEPVPADAVVGDRLSMAFAGTLVQIGRGSGIVVATGARTEIGKISALLGSVEPLTTPLLLQIDRFARWLSAVIVLLAGAVFSFGSFVHNYPLGEMFLAAVALAVAAIPEGLPAIITITLALGVQMMARRNAIVRRLPAVEALGAVTVICSDKTGTLTRSEMMVATLLTPDGAWHASGSGYMPDGNLNPIENDAGCPDAGALQRLLEAAVLCNDARVVYEDDGAPVILGDATEAALQVVAAKGGVDDAAVHAAHARRDVIPFESEQRYMATRHDGFALLKGAPEVVLPLCDAGDAWRTRVAECAARGQRMLALARRDGDRIAPDGGVWTLLGLVGLVDPPRPEVHAAVNECHAAGIRVKMITGDHAMTAVAIGAELGIGDGMRALTGTELDALDDDALTAAAMDIDVFARVSPQHKLRLVEALQRAGQVVAMTGDGVNDAPALKRASVGVAMGRKGTEAARQAAEVVLADDNFASITAAVAEGRRIYDNIQKAILFILPTNAGQALAVGVAVLFGSSLPLTPVQVLWVNMVTAVTLALALVFEAAERDVMRRTPRRPDAPILTPMLVQRTLLVGLLMLAATFGLFMLERAAGASIEYARTAAVNALVLCEIFYLLNSRYLTAPLTPRNALAGNRWIPTAIVAVLFLQIAFTYWPPLQRLFGTAGLDAFAWARAVGAGIGVLVIVEVEKYFRRRTHK